MEMPVYEALIQLSEYGNGIYTLPDGEEVMLYDVINNGPDVDYGPVVRVEWSAPNVAVLTAMSEDGFREESFGRIEF